VTDYRRARVQGGCYFFTVALAQRSQGLLVERIDLLRKVTREVRNRHPFTIDAMVVLPDHLHCIWTLPEQDADYSKRWFLIKSAFSRQIEGGEYRRGSRIARGERGIWQRRFWEHAIRDGRDFSNHIDYIHINPVKHGYAARAIDWPHSSIHRYVKQGLCAPDWAAEAFILDWDRE
jgi:putative transposase